MPEETPRWVQKAVPRPSARLKLFCFPYAGSGASVYRAWPAGLSPEVEVCAVQLPGREARWNDPAITTIDGLVAAMVEGLASEFDRPFALYGHSMGSLLSFELARALREKSLFPEVIFVSGRWAPDWPRNDASIAHLGNAELIQEVNRRHQGIPKEILASEELSGLFADILRSDMAAIESYRFRPAPPLSSPIVALWGDRDRPTEESVDAWRAHTAGRFAIYEMPGDHFFLNSEREQLLERVNLELRPILRRLAGSA
ncbi:MAG: alpha/beta fold hydrolase [Myxococcota bacterium]